MFVNDTKEPHKPAATVSPAKDRETAAAVQCQRLAEIQRCRERVVPRAGWEPSALAVPIAVPCVACSVVLLLLSCPGHMEIFTGSDGREYAKYNLKTQREFKPLSLDPLDLGTRRLRREGWGRHAEGRPRLGAASRAAGSPLDDLVDLLLAEARRIEPQITALLQRLALSYGGGMRLVDLEHCFKSRASISAKLKRFADRYHGQHPELTRAEVEAKLLRLHSSEPGKAGDPIVVDALRYTMLIPTPVYTEAVKLMRESLTGSACMELIDAKNFWHGEQLYRGINDCYSMPQPRSSQVRRYFLEVQAHTAESIGLKHEIHSLHELEREATDAQTKEQLQRQMLEKAHELPQPRRVLSLPTAVVRPPWWNAHINKELAQRAAEPRVRRVVRERSGVGQAQPSNHEPDEPDEHGHGEDMGEEVRAAA